MLFIIKSCFRSSKEESVLVTNVYLCLQEKLLTLHSPLFMLSLMWSVLWSLDIVSPCRMKLSASWLKHTIVWWLLGTATLTMWENDTFNKQIIQLLNIIFIALPCNVNCSVIYYHSILFNHKKCWFKNTDDECELGLECFGFDITKLVQIITVRISQERQCAWDAKLFCNGKTSIIEVKSDTFLLE